MNKSKLRSDIFLSIIFAFSRKFLIVILTTYFISKTSPEFLGLLSICLLIVGMVTIFSEAGFKISLIQADEEKIHTKDLLDTAFALNIIRGILLTFIILIFNGSFAAFFNNSDIKSLITYFSLIPLSQGLINIEYIYQEKLSNFKLIYKIEGASVILTIFLSIIALLLYDSKIALIAISILPHITLTILTYVLLPVKNTVKISSSARKFFFSNGKWHLLNALLYYGNYELDKLIVAKSFGLTQVGYYNFTYKLVGKPINDLTKAIGKVIFPHISSNKNNNHFNLIINRLYLNSTLAIIGFFTSKYIITIFFEEKWHGTIYIIQLYCLYVLSNNFNYSTKGIWNGLNLQKDLSKNSIIKITIFLILFLLSYLIGISIEKLIISLILSSLTVIPFQLNQLGKKMNVSIIKKYLSITFLIFLIVVLSILVVGIKLYIDFLFLILILFINHLAFKKYGNTSVQLI